MTGGIGTINTAPALPQPPAHPLPNTGLMSDSPLKTGVPMFRCVSARIIQGDQNATEAGNFSDSRPRIDKQMNS